ncbi:hypothetical protein [Saccharopolyspora sp. CA-218241]|uniref:hypothetical protein n=1 Tax=Saccharopolyspora sp. CA-218241 TaxID=3240027 RepID=UPI003D99A9B0
MGSEPTTSGERTPGTRGTAVRDVVHDVVVAVAPEERPVVLGLSRLDDDAVVRRLRDQRGRREPLGFGLGDLVVMVTPVVWLVLDEAARKVVGSAVDGAAKGLGAGLRKVFRKRPAAVEVPPLTREQLAEVRQRVLEAARQRGMPEERAIAVADAVVARLALESDEGDTTAG